MFQIGGTAADYDELRHARLPDQWSGEGVPVTGGHAGEQGGHPHVAAGARQ